MQMDEISKKDLLKETGISYGQLYRWKRESLIPEEWFIKRASFTGQETFFPRARTLDRVRAILALKDDLSLEEIRARLQDAAAAVVLREGLAAATGTEPAFWDGLDAHAKLERLPPGAFVAAVCVYEAGLEAGLPPGKLLALVSGAIAKTTELPRPPAQAAFFESGGGLHFILVGTECEMAADDGIPGFRLVRIADVLERIRAAHPEILANDRPI